MSGLETESAGNDAGKPVHEPKIFDWARFWQSGMEKMREQLPEFAEQWINKQMKNGCIKVYDVPSLSYKEIGIDG